jgi:hypothetical protein
MAYPGQCEQQSAGCGLDFQYLVLDEPPWVSLGGSCFWGGVKDEDGLRPPVIDPGTPGFPVKLGGVGALHAAFLKESRTRLVG